MEDADEKPIVIAWLKNSSSQAEVDGNRVYEQFYEEVFNPDLERSKVITLHLYVEYWLDKIFEKLSAPAPEMFWKKVNALNMKGVFDKPLYENLLTINRLRNIYAHELNLQSANEKVFDLISKMTLDPYFVSTDQDHFRLICIQTMFLLEATYNNGGRQPELIFPADAVREKLRKEGKLHWQECELIAKEQISKYVHKVSLRCPYCSTGTIIREKDDTPGFRESDMTICEQCGLTGDGAYLDFNTIKNP